MKKKERVQICLRLDYELNTKLIQIAEFEDMSKNKLIEKELRKMAKEYHKKNKIKENEL